MSAKEKTKPGAPRQDHSKDTDRQKEIERLEKDVEELRHLAGNADAETELQHVREQVAELRRDRGYADDKAIITGLGKFHGRPVAIIRHQKERNTKQQLVRNFGQPKPEGYRK